MCSHASSSWFSSRMISNISGGHCANFSAATIWTLRLRLCDLPRDLINRWSTCNGNHFISWWSFQLNQTQFIGPICLLLERRSWDKLSKVPTRSWPIEMDDWSYHNPRRPTRATEKEDKNKKSINYIKFFFKHSCYNQLPEVFLLTQRFVQSLPGLRQCSWNVSWTAP